jgi:hypothetical protein
MKRIKGILHEDYTLFDDMFLGSSCNKKVFQTKLVEKMKTHIL